MLRKLNKKLRLKTIEHWHFAVWRSIVGRQVRQVSYLTYLTQQVRYVRQVKVPTSTLNPHSLHSTESICVILVNSTGIWSFCLIGGTFLYKNLQILASLFEDFSECARSTDDASVLVFGNQYFEMNTRQAWQLFASIKQYLINCSFQFQSAYLRLQPNLNELPLFPTINATFSTVLNEFCRNGHVVSQFSLFFMKIYNQHKNRFHNMHNRKFIAHIRTSQ